MKLFEQGFLKRVYELSFLVSLWVTAFFLIGKLFTQGFSFLSGAWLGILLLIGMDLIVHKITQPGASKKSKSAVLAWIFVKYPFIGILFYHLVRWDKFSMPFFALGLTLPYLVIFLKGAWGPSTIKMKKETPADA